MRVVVRSGYELRSMAMRQAFAWVLVHPALVVVGLSFDGAFQLTIRAVCRQVGGIGD